MARSAASVSGRTRQERLTRAPLGAGRPALGAPGLGPRLLGLDCISKSFHAADAKFLCGVAAIFRAEIGNEFNHSGE